MASTKPSAKSSTVTPFCKVCFKKIEGLSIGRLFFPSIPLCARCFNQMKPKLQRFCEKRVRFYFLYPYEEAFRSMLYQFKGCGDIELAPTFLCRQALYLKIRFFGYTIVPAPSSPSHDEKRGFNQIEEAVKILGLPVIKAIEKPFESKQSDLSARERKKVKKLLRLKDAKLVKGKKILLVDDVFTTGSTSRACVELLKKAGAKKICVLVFAKVNNRVKG